MSDSNNKTDSDRRDFLRGGFLRRALQETEAAQAPVRPNPPVHTPAPQQANQSPTESAPQPGEALTPEQQIELARARARAMIGVVKPPTDQKPFDILSLLTSFDRKPDHQDDPDDQPMLAHIDSARCLAHAGSFCTVCSEHCPAEGAIEIHDHLPKINQDACTGCAECYRVCPAPVIAIVLTPVEQPAPSA